MKGLDLAMLTILGHPFFRSCEGCGNPEGCAPWYSQGLEWGCRAIIP